MRKALLSENSVLLEAEFVIFIERYIMSAEIVTTGNRSNF